MCQAGNARVKNHLATKTTVSAIEPECNVGRSANAWTAETGNPTTVILGLTALGWKSNISKSPPWHDPNKLLHIITF